MKTISHAKARQHLHQPQASLKQEQRQELESHLFVCESCRRYGREVAGLERDLGRYFHSRLDPAPTPVGIAGVVQERLRRANRKRRWTSLAGSLAGMLALVILLGILFELFSGSRLPAVETTPLPKGTERAGESSGGATGTPPEDTPLPTGETPSLESPPVPIASGEWIAFTSRRDGNEEIYIMDTDGGNPANLTSHPAADYLPTWSPDGRRLAFVSDRSGKPEVYRMNVDGSGLVQMTDLPYSAGYPSLSWSPDGTRLAAEVLLTYEMTGELYGRIFLIQADGSGVQDLTRNELPARTYDPQWSPDGEWIAYVRGGQAPRYLRKIRPDGTADTKLNLSLRNTRAYDWSPDGSSLAYITSCTYCEVYDDEPPDLRLMIPDGSEPDTLIRFEDLSLDFFNLSWSPGGSYLALTANEGEESIRHLYLLEAGSRQLLDVAAFEPGDWYLSFLSWSPDGKFIVLDAGREEERDIYVVDLEARLRGGVGAGVANLTGGSPGMDYQPQWQP